MSKVRVISGVLGMEVGDWVAYEDYQKLETLLIEYKDAECRAVKSQGDTLRRWQESEESKNYLPSGQTKDERIAELESKLHDENCPSWNEHPPTLWRIYLDRYRYQIAITDKLNERIKKLEEKINAVREILEDRL
jgi:hypothetical protein